MLCLGTIWTIVEVGMACKAGHKAKSIKNPGGINYVGGRQAKQSRKPTTIGYTLERLGKMIEGPQNLEPHEEDRSTPTDHRTLNPHEEDHSTPTKHRAS